MLLFFLLKLNLYYIFTIFKNLKTLYLGLFSNLVPLVGVEPTWISPMVFETIASTNSAITASL